MPGSQQITILLLGRAPGLEKEVEALRLVFTTLGASVATVILSRDEGHRDLFYWFVQTFRTRRKRVRMTILYNNSLLNSIVFIFSRTFGPVITVAVVHEPPKQTAELAIGFRVRRWLAEFAQHATIALATGVVLPSENAERRFRLSYPRYRGKVIRSALIIPPPTSQGEEPSSVNWLTYPGRPNGSTGHSTFFRLAQELYRLGIPVLLLHKGAPRSEYWLTLESPELLEFDGEVDLTDLTISRIFSRSVAVLRLDESSAQSGTIPVAFSVGTPVIVRDREGLTEGLRPGFDSIVISSHPDAAEIAAAYVWVKRHRSSMSAEAVLSYTRRHSLTAGLSVIGEPLLEMFRAHDQKLSNY